MQTASGFASSLAIVAVLGVAGSAAERNAPAVDLTKMVDTVAGETWPDGKAPSGSGFVVGPRGQVLTNAHVVAGCKDVRVVEPGREPLPAVVLGSDSRIDAAVLIVAGLESKPFVRFTDEESEVGDDVVVMAYSVGNGKVRVIRGRSLGASNVSGEGELLQLKAGLSPGSSGSPVFNHDGLAIGYVVGRLRETPGVGLAVQTKTVAPLLSYFNLPSPARPASAAVAMWNDLTGDDHRAAEKAEALAETLTVNVICR